MALTSTTSTASSVNGKTQVFVDLAHIFTREMSLPRERALTNAEFSIYQADKPHEHEGRKFRAMTLADATELGLPFTTKIGEPMVIADNGPQVRVDKDIFDRSVAGVSFALIADAANANIADQRSALAHIGIEPNLQQAISAEFATHFNTKEPEVTIPAAVANALGIISQTTVTCNSVENDTGAVFLLRSAFLTSANNVKLAASSPAVTEETGISSQRALIIRQAGIFANRHKDSAADIIPIPERLADYLGLVQRYASADAEPGKPINLRGGISGKQVDYHLTAL